MRRFSRLLLLALVAMVIGFYPLLAPTPHRIDQEHFDLIQDGMTKAEVEAIFGMPAGQYDWAEPDSPFFFDILYFTMGRSAYQEVLQRQPAVEMGISFLRSRETSFSENWVSRHGGFTVFFGNDDRVFSTTGGHGVRIVPPWQRWWKAIWER